MRIAVKIKPKTCRECKGKFLPKMALQVVCGLKCSISYAKKKTEEKEKKEWAKRKKEGKESLKTKSEYEKDLEKEINQIVRLIDKGHNCISSGRSNYTVNAGHFFAVGSNPSLRFNLLNIYAQSVGDNMFKGGAPREYLEGLCKTFGEETANEISELKASYPEIKLSIEELKETIKVARRCVKDLKKLNGDSEKPWITKDRIELRRFYNSVLGIY